MSKKKNIAVLAGGFSGEDVISLKSANMVMNNIDKELFDPILIIINQEKWVAKHGNLEFPIDKNDFSVTIHGEIVTFDCAFIIIHGTPGEDGKLQGYFDMIGIPYTTGGTLNTSLTFDKYTCNNYLRNFGFQSAQSFRIDKNELYSTSEICTKLGLPIFIKPNRGGSSLGMSKVFEKEAIHEAIEKAFTVSDQVIVEEYLEGAEVTCGVIIKDGELLALPLTEIVSENEFFDYQAKYEGSSNEITPARINKEMTEKVQELSKRIYKILNCRGMIRADYILKNDEPFLIEVNTVPGFSEESIIPQQAAAAGISKKELITAVIESCV